MFHLYYLAKPRVVKSVAVKTILVVNIVTHSCVTDYSVDNPINSHSGNIPTLNVSLPLIHLLDGALTLLVER